MGLATNTEEYVPIMIPQTSANENPPSTGPPQMNRAITVRNVRPEVMTVRLNVWFTARFITASSGSLRENFKFSRIRSKITMVSFME